MKYTIFGLAAFLTSFGITFFSTQLLLEPVNVTLANEMPEPEVEGESVIQSVPEIVPVPEPALPLPPPPELRDALWTLATSSASWEARDSAASVVFKDRMWIMGGLNGNGVPGEAEHTPDYMEAKYFNDIWSSTDGAVWKRESAHAAWKPKRSMTIVPFNNSLWMYAGWSPEDGYEKGVWKSEDGIAWKRVVLTVPWSSREGQSIEVFKGKIWLMGGVNYDTREVLHDVWYSDDGITWIEAPPAPWSGRWDHATAVFNDRLYLTGGMNLRKGTFGDVWYTDDGITWQSATQTPWASRQGHSLIIFSDALWLIGRLNDTEGRGENDVWFTKDGVKWEKTEKNPEWAGREDHSALLFNNAVYLMGGMDSDWKWRNDVWRMGVRTN